MKLSTFTDYINIPFKTSTKSINIAFKNDFYFLIVFRYYLKKSSEIIFIVFSPKTRSIRYIFLHFSINNEFIYSMQV